MIDGGNGDERFEKRDEDAKGAKGQTSSAGKDGDDVADVGGTFKVRDLAGKRQVLAGDVSSGRRSQALDTRFGGVVRSAIPTKKLTTMGEVALAETIKVAAVRSAQSTLTSKLGSGGQALRVEMQDLRRKVRSAKVANLVLFVVDGSGSMAARKRMVAVKGAILSLLIDAYQKRDRVGMIVFKGDGAEVVLRPTNSVDLAQRKLARLPTGGKTPLADGLLLAEKVLERYEKGENRVEPLIVILSDGRGNGRVRGDASPMEEAKLAAGRIAEKGWKSVVIDCESGYPRLGLAVVIAQAMGGECVKLEELSAESVSGLVRKKVEAGGFYSS